MSVNDAAIAASEAVATAGQSVARLVTVAHEANDRALTAEQLSADLRARVAELEAKVPTHRTVLRIDAARLPLGPVSSAVWHVLTGHQISPGGLRYMSVVDTAFGRVIRHHLPASSTAGTAFTFALPETLEKATMRTEVVHPNGFPWGLGGKHPGLAGALPGSRPPAGGDYGGDVSWAGRVMWGAGGRAESYMYGPLQPTRTKPPGQQYGQGCAWASKAPIFVPDMLQRYEVDYDLPEARLVARLGQRTVLDQPYTFRTRPDVGINAVQWSFFAGGDVKWSVPEPRDIDIKSFEVMTPV